MLAQKECPFKMERLPTSFQKPLIHIPTHKVRMPVFSYAHQHWILSISKLKQSRTRISVMIVHSVSWFICVAIKHTHTHTHTRLGNSLAHSSAHCTKSMAPVSASGEASGCFHWWQKVKGNCHVQRSQGNRSKARDRGQGSGFLFSGEQIKPEVTHYLEDGTKPFMKDLPPWSKYFPLDPISNIGDHVSTRNVGVQTSKPLYVVS